MTPSGLVRTCSLGMAPCEKRRSHSVERSVLGPSVKSRSKRTSGLASLYRATQGSRERRAERMGRRDSKERARFLFRTRSRRRKVALENGADTLKKRLSIGRQVGTRLVSVKKPEADFALKPLRAPGKRRTGDAQISRRSLQARVSCQRLEGLQQSDVVNFLHFDCTARRAVVLRFKLDSVASWRLVGSSGSFYASGNALKSAVQPIKENI